MTMTSFHRSTSFKSPGYSKAFQNTYNDQKVVAEVMINTVEENEAPVGAEWKGEQESWYS